MSIKSETITRVEHHLIAPTECSLQYTECFFVSPGPTINMCAHELLGKAQLVADKTI